MHYPVTVRRSERGKEKSILSSSSSIIDSDPDILRLILARLPLKSLLVSTSVSKLWDFLISGDPQFVHHYSLQNPRFSFPAGLFWESYSHYSEYIPIDGQIITSSSPPLRALNKREDGVIIMESCNGLLLCRKDSLDCRICSFYIFNPFTNKRSEKNLPPSRSQKQGFTKLWKVCLAFDPLKSPPHYKVICFWYKGFAMDKCRVEIYSSESSRSRRWDVCGEEYSFPSSYHESGVVFWNGSLNWVSKQGSLFYFNIDRKTTAEVPRHLPDDVEKWETNYKINCFGTYEGDLRFIEVSRKASTLNVFHMDIHRTGWKLKYLVNLEGLEVPYPRLSSDYSVIYLVEGEKTANLVILVHDCKIISYDPNKMSSTKLRDIRRRVGPGTSLREVQYDVYEYIESLAHV